MSLQNVSSQQPEFFEKPNHGQVVIIIILQINRSIQLWIHEFQPDSNREKMIHDLVSRSGSNFWQLYEYAIAELQ